MQNKENTAFQARHQDSVTGGGGGADINFEGAREVYLCEFERGTGAREIYPSLDQMNKLKNKDSEGFSGWNQKLKRFLWPKTVISPPQKKVFTEIVRNFPAEIGNSNGFSGRKQVISKKKKKKRKSSSQKCHEIRCQSTKITKILMANTNLGLDLHSRSPDLVDFFGAQSSLGGRGTIFVWGGTSSHLGGARPRNAPPWRRVCRVFSTSDTVFCTGIDSMI